MVVVRRVGGRTQSGRSRTLTTGGHSNNLCQCTHGCSDALPLQAQNISSIRKDPTKHLPQEVRGGRRTKFRKKVRVRRLHSRSKENRVKIGRAEVEATAHYFMLTIGHRCCGFGWTKDRGSTGLRPTSASRQMLSERPQLSLRSLPRLPQRISWIIHAESSSPRCQPTDHRRRFSGRSPQMLEDASCLRA